MKKTLLFIIAIWAPTIYACGGNAGEIKKYINHISIEKKSGNKNQCRHMEILFKEKNTYPSFIESAYVNLIQNKVTISQVPINIQEIIDGVNYARFCLSDRLIEESKISFIVKQNETVKITSKGLIEHSAGSLCFAEIIVDVKDLSATASIIDSP